MEVTDAFNIELVMAKLARRPELMTLDLEDLEDRIGGAPKVDAAIAGTIYKVRILVQVHEAKPISRDTNKGLMLLGYIVETTENVGMQIVKKVLIVGFVHRRGPRVSSKAMNITSLSLRARACQCI